MDHKKAANTMASGPIYGQARRRLSNMGNFLLHGENISLPCPMAMHTSDVDKKNYQAGEDLLQVGYLLQITADLSIHQELYKINPP